MDCYALRSKEGHVMLSPLLGRKERSEHAK